MSRVIPNNSIKNELILVIARIVLMPAITLPSHRWARELYREIEAELLTSDIAEEDQIRATLYNLKSQQYIKLVHSKNGKRARLELTHKGKKLLASATIKNMRINKPQRWDEQWRFVVFDVPEKYRHARDIMRDKLKKLGFFRVQQSVWTYPHPCEGEIALLTEYFRIQPYVLVLTSSLRSDAELRKLFNV